jgi:hypothetical protein
MIVGYFSSFAELFYSIHSSRCWYSLCKRIFGWECNNGIIDMPAIAPTCFRWVKRTTPEAIGKKTNRQIGKTESSRSAETILIPHLMLPSSPKVS